MTKEDEIYLKMEYVQNAESDWQLKPSGLWYSIENHWIDWCQSEMEERIYQNIFSLEIDESRLLKIDTIDNLMAFQMQYENGLPGLSKSIAWINLVKEKKYAGIEFLNYWRIKKQTLNLPDWRTMWYWSIDVPSGCIWDLSAIIAIEKIELVK